jgi:hypothetical protein
MFMVPMLFPGATVPLFTSAPWPAAACLGSVPSP